MRLLPRAITLFTRVAGCSGRPGALSLHAAVRVTLMVLSRRSREQPTLDELRVHLSLGNALKVDEHWRRFRKLTGLTIFWKAAEAVTVSIAV